MARSKVVLRVKGFGFLLWHGRHYAYHILIGLLWAWVVREIFETFSARDIFVAILGSLLPDLDHLVYWLSWGKHDDYTVKIIELFRTRQWRNFVVFCERSHKHNTSLMTHNIYFMLLISLIAGIAFYFDRRTSLVFLGAMVSHYSFDIFDDIATLGYINSNWKRWGRKKPGKNKHGMSAAQVKEQ